MKPERLSKYYYLRLKRLQGNPHELALGFAIGVFIGITPTIPFHTILIIVLTLLTRSSFIAGILSSWLVCNPLTTIPIYYLALLVGNAVTPYSFSWDTVETVIDSLFSADSFSQSFSVLANIGFEVTVVMVSGGVIIAIPFAILSYFLSLNFFVAYRQKRLRKHILN